MATYDDDERRGANVPRGVPPRPGADGGRAAATRNHAAGGLREGDTGLGRPSQAPEDSRELTVAEDRAIREEVDREDENAASLALDGGVHLPRFLFNTTFVLAVAALGAALVLFVLAQTAVLLERVAASPPWLRTTAWGAVAVLLAVVAAAAVRLAWVWARLRRTRQVNVDALDALADRRGLRRLAATQLEAATRSLRELVAGYPLDGAKNARALVRAGFTEDEVETLRRQRAALLDEGRHPGAADWLRSFRGSFQDVLDAAARRRVGTAVKLVAVKTAVTPRTVDTAVVLHASLRLIGDLARIYRLRLSTMGTAVVLGRAFVFAYLTSHVQDVTEDLTRDAASHGAAQLLEGLPEGIGQAGSKLAGLVVPKAAEGVANGIMLYRLGAAAIRLLRPVA